MNREQRRVPAGSYECQEGGLNARGRRQVTPQVMHGQERHVEPPGERLAVAQAHQQGAHEARPVSGGYGRHVAQGKARLFERLPNRLVDHLQVLA